MSSVARKFRRGSLINETMMIGNNTYLVTKRKSNGGNSKKTKGRRKHPKSKWVILNTVLLTPNGVSSNM